ncbi:5080_t:CDS:1, partial [Ambispora gerdemannii]
PTNISPTELIQQHADNQSIMSSPSLDSSNGVKESIDITIFATKLGETLVPGLKAATLVIDSIFASRKT